MIPSHRTKKLQQEINKLKFTEMKIANNNNDISNSSMICQWQT